MLNLTTLLFTPGNRKERFDSARTYGADGILIDLEDAVGLDDKVLAREIVIEYFIKNSEASDFKRCIRINSIRSILGFKDIIAIVENHLQPDAIVLPKVEYAGEINVLDGLLKYPLNYIVMIETPLGLSNIEGILRASPNVKGVAFGGGDFTATLGGTIVKWDPLLIARSQIAYAGSALGIDIIDSPFFALNDLEGLKAETIKVKEMGFTGKFALHPDQVDPIKEAFRPTQSEVDKAKKVLAAFEKAQGNACQVDGKMIDEPIVRLAERILHLSKR